MVRRFAVVLAVAALTACAGPTGDPLAARPYLVAVDPGDEALIGEVAGTLVVARDCVLLEDEEGPLLPLFAAPTAFGPLDGETLTVVVAGHQLRIGQEVVFEGRVGTFTEGVRSRYPGVDATRCGVRRYALLGEVVG